MTTITETLEPTLLYVVHPLDDKPEEKCSPEGLDHIAMTPSVKLSLYALRGYLVLVVGLALYHLADLFAKAMHHAV